VSRIPEETAANILRVAIHRRRAAEMLECLWDGGAVTFDPVAEDLVMIPGSAFAAWVQDQQELAPPAKENPR
jgi:hypothetical protein